MYVKTSYTQAELGWMMFLKAYVHVICYECDGINMLSSIANRDTLHLCYLLYSSSLRSDDFSICDILIEMYTKKKIIIVIVLVD